MNLSSLILLTTLAASTAFSPASTAKWGILNTQKVSQTQLFEDAVDTNFEGVDVVRLLGYNRVNKLIKKGERNSQSSGLKLIIAGAPASGKGTQCELIKKEYGVVHLSTGDMLRAAVAAGSEVGTAAKEYMDAGKLVPDEVIIGVVNDRLNADDCKANGWLLDGFPRTPAQAEALAAAGIEADCFLFLNVPDDILVERVVGRRTDPETGKIYHMTFSPPEDEEVLARLEQRSDDTEEKVKVRLEQFHSNVEAVKGSYSDIGVEIDGTASPAEVAKAVAAAIKSKVNA
jgi:adenylate kinase